MCLPSCQCFGHWGRHPISYGSNCVNVESPRSEEGIYVSGKMVAIGETKHPRSEERAESTHILASKRNLYVSLRSGSAPWYSLTPFGDYTLVYMLPYIRMLTPGLCSMIIHARFGKRRVVNRVSLTCVISNALGSFRGCTLADSLMTFPEVSFFSGASSPVFRKFFPILEFL
ncbi:hypothetical protein VNO77_04321 [Canavalia gladiata]|uniref:Uncharacterized protein n=1 Tax=Canavalia gladiata TaxID=3824 RepID=A0AAN9MWB2_CANGL